MEALNEYLWMGGDGIFIWSAYSAAAILLGGLALVMLVGKRSVDCLLYTSDAADE